MHCHHGCPFAPVEPGEESLDIYHLQSPAEWLEPRRVFFQTLRYQPKAGPQEELSWHSDPPASEAAPYGCPGPTNNSNVTDQLLAGLRGSCLLAQVHQKSAPACVPAHHSQGEAGWELDLHLELTTGAEKSRQWAHAWTLLLRQMCCQFTLIVAATAATELFILPDGGLTQFIRQRN